MASTLITVANGVFIKHMLLDEGEPGLAQHRLATMLLADIDCIPDQIDQAQNFFLAEHIVTLPARQ